MNVIMTYLKSDRLIWLAFSLLFFFSLPLFFPSPPPSLTSYFTFYSYLSPGLSPSRPFLFFYSPSFPFFSFFSFPLPSPFPLSPSLPLPFFKMIGGAAAPCPLWRRPCLHLNAFKGDVNYVSFPWSDSGPTGYDYGRRNRNNHVSATYAKFCLFRES